MLNWIKKFYNKNELSDEMFLFNIIHTICFIGMIVFCVIINFSFEDKRALYICYGICGLFFLTMVEANRTKKLTLSIILMSLMFNFIFMPALFYFFGRYVCVISIYFIFGILYSILLLEFKYSIIMFCCETVFYYVLLSYFCNLMPSGLENPTVNDIRITYLGAFLATVIVGLCCGAAVRIRFMTYEKVRDEAERLKAEAMEAYVAKDKFLTNMSHEIRTPMNAIVGMVDLLLDQEVSEHVSDSVYNILNSCNALLSITDELMDLSKSDTGEVELYYSTYDLNDLLLEIINMMTVRLTESNLEFFVDINKQIPRFLYGDSSKIRQVLVNVLNNAIKFTQVGRISLRVDFKTLGKDSIELIIDVEDTGEGIKKEDIPKLFKHNPSDNEDQSDGEEKSENGMGLIICSEILEEMKGSISVTSEYKKGSVFTVKIPQKYTAKDPVANISDPSMFKILIFERNQDCYYQVKKILDLLEIESDQAKNRQDLERLMNVNTYSHVFIANEKSEECEQFLNDRLISEKIVAFLEIDDNIQIGKATTILNRPINIINIVSLLKNETNSYVREISRKGGFSCKGATVLVVDDNYTNLNVASALISRYGPTVLTAPSGKECLKIVNEQNVDIIFLDYMMPEMNGVDTLELIRKISGSKYAAIPIIALTANVVSGAREMFLEAGFDDFLPKPLSVDRLEKTLKKYLPRELVINKKD